MDRLFRLILALVLLLLVCPAARGAALFGLLGNERVEVSGFGWFADLYLERALEILDSGDEDRERFDGVYLEDAVWILAGEIKQKGYLEPRISVSLTENGQKVFRSAWAEGDLNPNPPRDISGDAVSFSVDAGRLFYFNRLSVEGLPSGFASNAASYFYATDQLIVSEGDRFFTEGRFQAGLERLLQALRAVGYRDATVAEADHDADSATGAVDAWAMIVPGPLYYADCIRVRRLEPEPAADLTVIPAVDPPDVTLTMAPSTSDHVESGQAIAERRVTPDWVASLLQDERRHWFRQGYPDVYVRADFEPARTEADRVVGTLVVTVEPGAPATVHGVRYTGNPGVADWLLRQQVPLTPGEPLDRTGAEDGRTGLSKLGVFRRVQIHYEEVEPGQWDVVYDLDPKGTTEVNLIFGVGSFDIVRGGFEVTWRNLLGAAHQVNFRAVQSFKATYADLGYQVPQLFGGDLDLFATINYVRREELTFVREEWGGNTGLQHYFEDWNLNASVNYTLENLRADDRNFIVPPGPLEARVGSFGLKFVQSDLDNPVFPTDGYHWFLTMTYARPDFGGNVSYDRYEVGGAWHHPLGDFGLTLHLGFKHGVIITDGEADEQIPVNRRFFQGGENTVRGYRRDAASPVNAYGKQIGAVSTMLWQGELQQALNDTFSLVVFVDAVGNAAFIEDYPFNETLVSVGGGVSVRTIIGPLRLEYGYNVKKREIDPSGRFQVGLGFPF